MNLWVFEDETVLEMFANADRVARANVCRDEHVSIAAREVADKIAIELTGRGFKYVNGAWKR